jgi:N6-L-threonylcarbamoyladenine synthase
MYCLGIESTAHTFSCAVISKKGKKIEMLSDVRKIYRPPEGEGIHPREASRHHIENSATVLRDTIDQSGIKISDLNLVSYAAGPGLGPCLRVGAVVARSLSSYYKIPIYPINHAIGHIELGKFLTGAKNPLVLLVSGGHTMLLAFLLGKWRVFGETLDITLGQLLDQFGRSIGFASPCGKQIEELASKTDDYVELPYVVKGNDVSFS